MLSLLQDVKRELGELQESISSLRSLSQQLALYFCEDYATFDLRLCLHHILYFCISIRRTQKVSDLLLYAASNL